MKIVCLILLCLGGLWAVLSWPIVLVLPVAIATLDVLDTLAGLLIISGYFIWYNWGYYWKNDRFLGMSRRGFWLFSFTHHSIWALILPLLRGVSFQNFYIEDPVYVFTLWIILNLAISLIFILVEITKFGKSKLVNRIGN